MKKGKRFGTVAVGVVIVMGVLWGVFGKKIKVLYISLNSFKNENLAYTFQHTPEIQPAKKISTGEESFQFLREENIALTGRFIFEDRSYPLEEFII